MGTSTSKCPEYESALARFNAQEQEEITKIFRGLCEEGKATFQKPKLQNFVGKYLIESLSDRLFSYMNHVLPPLPGKGSSRPTSPTMSGVFFHSYLVALSHILKGTPEEKAKLVCHLAAGGSTASAKQLIQFIADMLETFKMTMQEGDEYTSWRLSNSQESYEKFAKYMLQDLVLKDCDKDSWKEFPMDGWYTDSGLELWLSGCSLLLNMMQKVFSKCFPISEHGDELGGSQVSGAAGIFPMCEGAMWNKFATLLDIPALLLLNHSLPYELRNQWRFLYGSRMHGESFARLVKFTLGQGPCLFVIKDTKGHIFGGFISETMSLRPQFFGSSRCFLFSLNPRMGVHFATGYNANFVYLNHGQATMPNGLGMGGQFGYFGLWIDYEYGKGHSKAKPKCTTFNSPQLSADEEFEIESMEVWGLGPEPTTGEENEEDQGDGAKITSVLDKDPEAKAMLSMVDRGGLSDGLRESDLTADTPEQHELPPMP